MKKLILVVLGLLALAAASFIAEGFLDAMLHGGSPERRLAKLSKEMNSGLPKQIDKETRLDLTIAGPGIRFTYLYTLVNVSSNDINAGKFTAVMKPRILNSYKTAPDLAAFRRMQVELEYQYRDKNSNVVARIVISPKDF